LTRRLMKRWSCSMRLLRYFTCRNSTRSPGWPLATAHRQDRSPHAVPPARAHDMPRPRDISRSCHIGHCDQRGLSLKKECQRLLSHVPGTYVRQMHSLPESGGLQLRAWSGARIGGETNHPISGALGQANSPRRLPI
jgi:hypothetical protein